MSFGTGQFTHILRDNFNPGMDDQLHLSYSGGEITYPFPYLNSVTVEVWEWITNFSTHFTGHVITNQCWG